VASKPSASIRDVGLWWPNKELLLESADEGRYEWVDPDDPRAVEVRGLQSDQCVGDCPPIPTDGNVLIHGDARHAVRALASDPAFTPLRGGVRLVYLDPPFNSKQGFGHYRDSFPHSVWLSMLRDRLAALKPLLSPTASVWVHLDDAEVHRARCVMDEVFGPEAFVATIVWQKRTTRESRAAFSSNHDYIHVYAPAGPRVWKRSRNHLVATEGIARNRDSDPRGPWIDAPFTAPGYRENQHYTIVNPAGIALRPPKGRSWYATEDVFKSLLADNCIWFPREGAGLPRLKRFLSAQKGLVPFSIWGPADTGTNDDATRHLMSLLPDVEVFATPKPEALMERIVHIGSDPGDVILDFFGGSGTTAAVAHKMGRRWVTVEASSEVLAKYTIPRLTKVVEGKDPGGVSQKVNWTGGGGFRVLHVMPSVFRVRA
jgi:adenine-specific DNA-methyltransferase